jgi:hypothetical protein
MTVPISDEFKAYALFSVRVDRFFHAISSYGMYHAALKAAYSMMPDRESYQAAIDNPHASEEMRRFLLMTHHALGLLGATNVFSDGGDLDTADIPTDILNFAFYTCYSFQWTLFENFVKKMINKAVTAEVLPKGVKNELKARWRQTERFLAYIESGSVFGHSLFRTMLPVLGWVPQIEECDYSDLDDIRRLRNDFIHGIETPEITEENIAKKQQRYTRSMWILRKYAENVQHEVETLLTGARP